MARGEAHQHERPRPSPDPARRERDRGRDAVHFGLNVQFVTPACNSCLRGKSSCLRIVYMGTKGDTNHMNNKKKWLTAAAVMALSTSIAFAAPHEGKFGGHGHGRRGQMFGKRMAEKLNLSDSQKQQIKDIRKASFDANK